MTPRARARRTSRATVAVALATSTVVGAFALIGCGSDEAQNVTPCWKDLPKQFDQLVPARTELHFDRDLYREAWSELTTTELGRGVVWDPSTEGQAQRQLQEWTLTVSDSIRSIVGRVVLRSADAGLIEDPKFVADLERIIEEEKVTDEEAHVIVNDFVLSWVSGDSNRTMLYEDERAILDAVEANNARLPERDCTSS